MRPSFAPSLFSSPASLSLSLSLSLSRSPSLPLPHPPPYLQILIRGVMASDEAQYTCEAVTRGVDGSLGEIVVLSPIPELQQFCCKCYKRVS